MNTEKLIEQVVARAAVDGEFRRRLLSDPEAAVAEVAGHPLPDGVRIRFVEKEAELDALVVLPDFQPGADRLAPEDLEAVAGGTLWAAAPAPPPTDDGDGH